MNNKRSVGSQYGPKTAISVIFGSLPFTIMNERRYLIRIGNRLSRSHVWRIGDHSPKTWAFTTFPVRTMGFYPQSNKWQCGPFALKHALAFVGRFVDEDALAKVARSTKDGTDEHMLTRAAASCECDLIEIRKTDEQSAFKALTSALSKGRPCLVCINQWGHWVTIVAFDAKSERFVVIDSEKNPVVRIPVWTELKRRWVYNEYDRDGVHRQYFDLYLLKPRFRVQTTPDFSIKRAQFLRRPSNVPFITHFDEYVSDLLNIARPCSPRSGKGAGLSMAEFLRRHRKMLVETVRYWSSQTTEAQLRRVLSNMQFVADTYGLVIRPDEEKRTIASFAALLMTWATTHEPLTEALYGD